MIKTEKTKSSRELAKPAKAPFRERLRQKLRFPKSWKEVKSRGWKFILAFFLFYLIRDTILYIIIPYLIYEGIISI
ncbi:MAG: hypothetical protein SGI97_09155 [candidate division Zixibacteria bacterium]|nr:hypothetical protein [candidate division Zixibacteria bacterium]